MTKRELVFKAFGNEPVERVPVGFWFHFLEFDQFNMALDYPELLEKVIEGHKKYRDDFDPDFVKMMTDGLFMRPRTSYPPVNCPKDLYKIKRLPEDHRYFEYSVKQAKAVRALFDKDVPVFFNIFSPLFHFTHMLNGNDDLSRTSAFLFEEPEAVVYALDVISQDLCYMTDRVIEEAGLDGIYLSVNNGGRVIREDLYKKYISPSEEKVLAEANSFTKHNILHICGWRGRTNIISCYRDYDAEVFNWAVHEEGLSLKAGKEYFHGKAVIGGFNQQQGELINVGSREAIQAEVDNILRESGTTGVIIGADCTVPADTPIEHLIWAREQASKYHS